MDFAVFPYIKSFLRGQRFNDLPELRQEVMNIILNMKTKQFEKIFDDWLKRCKKCSGKSLNLCPRRNDLMYGNTAKSIGAKSGLYGGCFRHLNPSKSNSS
jgi:hypothetical protein